MFVRIPELLFQPSMMGVEQAGITETIQFVLSKYPAEIQNKLTQVKVDFIFLPLGDSDD